jgi:phage shock protein PspC (stress-responsive transcriptional regulator)
MRRLTRSTHDRMVSGVSGGLGAYLDVDPVLIRIAWVLAAFLSCGAAILLYLAFWFVMPSAERVYPYQ